ncbi:hypothetical protein HME9302_00379 [Alteripontixanthobacter maritimus]|uniref:DUF2254 domain-containing protein n=1 Tax=Alteripontixanthobacter maritimus TaxID=2161824 RepID=A0A369Q352_9SPHN|nr:DUF2254 family protein [Alteripontixanthobacter maritimus]RDC59194.1 hypothetical protein HME9302_00379 [Alteripontixanthobacter maritimus]
MAQNTPLNGLNAWLKHRLVANYWSLPLVAVVAAPLVAAIALWMDQSFAAAWLDQRGWSPVATADTAQEIAGISVGISAAFISLYFSITLIVLTLATGNLGVRLIDRWLDKGLVRLSMSGLAFSLVYSLVVLARIDGDAALADTPLLALSGIILVQIVNVAMLGAALHDLGRTMFVDRSIAHIGKEAGSIALPIVGRDAFTGEFGFTLTAPREGYVEGIDLDRIRHLLGDDGMHVRFCAPPGEHVLEGETLAMFEREPKNVAKIQRAIAIGDYRSSAQSTVFQVRLLVEVATRAMSPGINDFYTALACVDRITCAMAGQSESWVDDSAMPAYATHHRFEVPEQDFKGLFDHPLDALRQSAAGYPAVTIRMIEKVDRLLVRLDAHDRPVQLSAYLRRKMRELAEHATARAEFPRDADDIRAAFARLDDHHPHLEAAA